MANVDLDEKILIVYRLSVCTRFGRPMFDFRRGMQSTRLSLFGVSLPTEVSHDTSGSSLGSYFIAALRQVMLWADDFVTDEAVFTPLVINFSYGFTAGPKDGSDPLNLVIQRMIDGRNAAGRTTAMRSLRALRRISLSRLILALRRHTPRQPKK